MLVFRKSRSIRLLLAAVMMICMLQLYPDRSEAAAAKGKWMKADKGWWYQFSDGSYAKSEYINGCWLNSKGWYEKEWDGTWKKNSRGWWFKAGDWYPRKQWLRIDGKSYYFDSKGYMVTNKWIGRYYVDSTGAWTKTRSSAKPTMRT